jgi:hypothetical protein
MSACSADLLNAWLDLQQVTILSGPNPRSWAKLSYTGRGDVRDGGRG